MYDFISMSMLPNAKIGAEIVHVMQNQKAFFQAGMQLPGILQLYFDDGTLKCEYRC